MGKSKIEFQINPAILDNLLDIQEHLPNTAIRANVKGGQGSSYDHPAGLALLGMKEDIVDTVVPLKMSGGCWDAPNINFEDMDKGLHKLIDADRICAGMALLRHPKWYPNCNEDNAKMPVHLRYQLHSLRNSFKDITKTAWIVVHNNYFRVYRPTKTEDGRVGAREVSMKSLFTEGSHKLLKSKVKRDSERKQRLADEKAAREAEYEKQRKAEAARRAREVKRHELMINKLAETNNKLKESKEDIIDAGGGYVFMKNKNGDYILWQTGR